MNITRKAQEMRAAQAEQDRWTTNVAARLKATAGLTANVMGAFARGASMDRLVNRAKSLKHGEAFFLGTDGVDDARAPAATRIETGWAIGEEGATFAVKMSQGGEVIIGQFDVQALAVLAEASTKALALYHDAGNQAKATGDCSIYRNAGAEASALYQKMLQNLADDHLALTGRTQQVYAEARAIADAEKRAAIAAQAEGAERRAERKVEGLIRKLSTAAQMGPGVERSLLLEEALPLVRRAFEGD